MFLPSWWEKILYSYRCGIFSFIFGGKGVQCAHEMFSIIINVWALLAYSLLLSVSGLAISAGVFSRGENALCSRKVFG